MKLNSQQLVELYAYQDHLMKIYPSLRKGQALFEAISEKYPELAKELVATDNDPFYDDGKIEECIKYICGI